MLHLCTETYNNERASKILGRISAETYLKMNYFISKSPKIANRRGLRRQTSVQAKWLENVEDPTRIELLVDADTWQFGGKIKPIFYIFCLPPV